MCWLLKKMVIKVIPKFPLMNSIGLEQILDKIESKTPKNKMHRILMGVGFLLLGVLGGFIPILQGWVFILIGLAILFEKDFTGKIKKLRKK